MSDQMVQLVASIATALFGVVIVLQLLIAVGILPITMAWGGRQKTLTVPLRIASVAAAVILGFFAYIPSRTAGGLKTAAGAVSNNTGRL